MNRKIIITGGTASGKTTLANFLAREDTLVLDEVHRKDDGDKVAQFFETEDDAILVVFVVEKERLFDRLRYVLDNSGLDPAIVDFEGVTVLTTSRWAGSGVTVQGTLASV